MVRLSVVLYSAGSGVNSVVVVFVGFTSSSFSIVHLCIVSMYGCSCVCACRWLVCVEVIVMSSAYAISSMLLGGGGMSAV